MVKATALQARNDRKVALPDFSCIMLQALRFVVYQTCRAFFLLKWRLQKYKAIIHMLHSIIMKLPRRNYYQIIVEDNKQLMQ